MKLAQSDFGGKLDAVTDSVVNFATFVGVAIAAYRMAGPLYPKLFRIFMIGCALCAATAYWVFKTCDEDSPVDCWRSSPRAIYVYGILPFALLGRMDLLMWAATIGGFVCPVVLCAICFSGAVTRRPEPAGCDRGAPNVVERKSSAEIGVN